MRVDTVLSLRAFVQHRRFDQTAIAITLLLPVALLYSRAFGDIILSVVAIQFLLNRAANQEWSWTRTPWTRLAGLFWSWQVICTILGGTTHALVEALVAIRLFLFAAAMENWVLAPAKHRQYLQRMFLAIAAWVGLESWQQYLLGRNVFGVPRWGDGSLTGPLFGPRAGLTYQTVFFPAFIPPVMHLLGQSRRMLRIAGVALLIIAVGTMVLIGQRMPTLLMVLGLGITGLLLRRFRWPLAGAVAVSIVLLAATPIISPPTYAKLVVHLYQQLQHFGESQYGLLYVRATMMLHAHPWLGLGFDGFRDNCADPRYFQTIPWLGLHDTGNELGCSIHPHNYWLQVATATGWPGILLFAALGLLWLRRIGHTVLSGASPVRVSLFVALCTILWPVASNTSMFTVPNAGWVFLLIGWGLAEARDDARPGANTVTRAAAGASL